MQGLTLSGILLYGASCGAAQGAPSPRSLLPVFQLRLVGDKDATHLLHLPLVQSSTDRWFPQLLSTDPHLCAVTSEYKPHSEAKLAGSPSHKSPPSRMEISEPSLHSRYFSGKVAGGGRKKKKN